MVDVRIKPLEWSSGWGIIKAETPIGHYFVEVRTDGAFDVRLEDVWRFWASSIDTAKDAAQADYERRIRSTLSDAVAEREAEPVASVAEVRADGQRLYNTVYPSDALDKFPIGTLLYTSPPTSELEALRKELDEATVYARNFLNAFVGKHFPDNDRWEPLDDLIGMLTQIDNASTIASKYKARIAALEAQLVEKVDAHATRIIDEAIHRCRELHDYAGRPAWEDAIRQAILSALEATPPAPKVTDEIADVAIQAFHSVGRYASERARMKAAITAAQEAGNP